MAGPQFQPARDHLSLGEAFFDPVEAADFPQTRLRYADRDWAARIGLGRLSDERWLAHFGRFEPFEGSLPQPLALKYHGHQFQHYNPDLGDGRGFLFAQMREPGTGRLLDFGTKGSGQTPYSRFGDGRLTLKGGVREVLATTRLEALGVNTSKTFALIETGESLHRNDEPSPTRSSVMTRLSHGHVRIGSFQRPYFLQEPEHLRQLLRYACQTYAPAIYDLAYGAEGGQGDAVAAPLFLRWVSANCAETVADWFAAGFVHGVLNTDNINITGESFDYGPYRFLPRLDPNFTAAYFDQSGLYAFGRQPEAVFWNLQQLAGTLVELTEQSALIAALQDYSRVLSQAVEHRLFRRLGLRASGDRDADQRFLQAFLGALKTSGLSFDETLHRAFGARAWPQGEDWREVSAMAAGFAVDRPERLDHPYFRADRPTSLVIEEIEALWEPIAEKDDWSAFEQKLADTRTMAEAYGFSPIVADGGQKALAAAEGQAEATGAATHAQS